MKKKILSFLLSITIIISLLLPFNAYSLSNLETTTGNVPGVDFTTSLAQYSEFSRKITDGAFYIPGLVNTVSYDKEYKCYASVPTMVPQAMCTVDQFTLITAYDSDENARSVIYVLDNNKNLVKTLILPDSYHVGGITYDLANRVILIAKATRSAVGVISVDSFYRYLSFNSPFIRVSYSVSESVSDVKISSASGVTYRNGRIYLTSFNSSGSSSAYCYIPTYDSANKTYSLKYQYKFYLPAYTQGITISNYKEKTRLFVSVSYGRSESKSIYCSYLYTYTFDEQTGNKTFDNILACPPMLQQTYCLGGKLYCLFESAADIYRSVNKNPVDVVVPLKLSQLCDEKRGSSVNISVSDVNDGKNIKIATNISGAKIYYSSGMPYIGGKSVKNAYSYKSSYTKTASGMVYAVAVLDGRIVASDAVYVTVGKASAPSKPKITAKSSKAVNLKWNKASNASGYYIYRSTSKNGKYTKIATVSSSKNTFKDKSVKSNKTYYYKVKAYRKGYKNSDFSTYVSVKTKKS